MIAQVRRIVQLVPWRLRFRCSTQLHRVSRPAESFHAPDPLLAGCHGVIWAWILIYPAYGELGAARMTPHKTERRMRRRPVRVDRRRYDEDFFEHVIRGLRCSPAQSRDAARHRFPSRK
jgi:hypothetical protein